MPLWDKENLKPPVYHPTAVLTRHGWTNPITGELLVVIKVPWLGPGKGIVQEQMGCAAIQHTTTQEIIGTSRIIPRQTTKKVQTIQGRARIAPYVHVCPEPINHGINPNW